MKNLEKMNCWIDINSPQKPLHDQTVLAMNNKFPHHLPDFVYWDEEEQEFMPIFPYSRLPVKITHWMEVPV